jgi:hypothetical protein
LHRFDQPPRCYVNHCEAGRGAYGNMGRRDRLGPAQADESEARVGGHGENVRRIAETFLQVLDDFERLGSMMMIMIMSSVMLVARRRRLK